MSEVLTLDHDGRITLPEKVRLRFRLHSGSQLLLDDEAEQIVLQPMPTSETARLVTASDGLPLIRGSAGEAIPDHRDLREDRLKSLSWSVD